GPRREPGRLRRSESASGTSPVGGRIDAAGASPLLCRFQFSKAPIIAHVPSVAIGYNPPANLQRSHATGAGSNGSTKGGRNPHSHRQQERPMADTTRYTKTEQGAIEISSRRKNLRGRERTMLILIDPSKTADELRGN